MKLSFKPGVTLFGIQAELLPAIICCHSIYTHHGHDCTITSLTDGKHSHTSLHYVGAAFDLRTRHLPEVQKTVIFDEICLALTDEFDVILEDSHIHVEFQPKR